MFAGIAPRYDLLNHLLSLGTDRWWRAAVARRVRRGLTGRAHPRVLDLCCGTGDLTRLLAGWGQVVGCDFCPEMLRVAQRKARRGEGWDGVRLVAGDALRLPFPDASFDAVCMAFGLRNLADPAAGLTEAGRVLRPGGRLAVLEFSRVMAPGVRQLFEWYFHRVLPRVGGWVSGRGSAYRYLPESVRRFPDAPALADQIAACGFTRVGYRRFSLGVVALHQGERS